MHRSTPVRAGLLGAAGVAALAGGLALLQSAKRLPSQPLPPLEAARVRRIFTAVNIIQWVAIATAVVVLLLLHLPEYMVPAIGILVGLHLYPLAGAFRNAMHSVTATLLVSWCTVCILLLPRGRMPGLGAFGTGAILFGSAVVTLLVAYSRTRSYVRVPIEADLLTR